MIIKNTKHGSLVEAITELDAHYIGFDPASNGYISHGMAPLMVYSKEQWSDATHSATPKLLTRGKREA